MGFADYNRAPAQVMYWSQLHVSQVYTVLTGQNMKTSSKLSLSVVCHTDLLRLTDISINTKLVRVWVYAHVTWIKGKVVFFCKTSCNVYGLFQGSITMGFAI